MYERKQQSLRWLNGGLIYFDRKIFRYNYTDYRNYQNFIPTENYPAVQYVCMLYVCMYVYACTFKKDYDSA